ncbi:Cytochrome P450 87A3 [Vitis vinifera]|uniref:Cytochrome P450 87A3 n=1 Tax=Vitis vinifera TaxID=29760 RepID=A0A438DB00_VITVI|nr:Cytochrome P450 87A3 [Vitis vinifera]
MWVLVICLIALVVILLSQWLQTWLNPKCNGRLPRGSMGLPIIGETIQFFSPHSFYGIPPFISKRMTKYGSVFKTSLVGNLVVVSGDSELNQYIFKEEGKSVYCSYTESALKIMGEQSLLAYHGVFHKYLKNLTLSMIGPESLKEVLLHEMDAVTRKYLHSCSSYASFDVKEESANMVFEYFAKKLFGYEEAKASKKLRESYKAFLDGLISFPLNIPGTAFHACLKGRENAIKVINNVINERKSSQKSCHDFLDFLLEEAKSKDTILNEAIIVDLVFLLLFASYETTSEAITLVMKFLSDHPSVVVELTVINETLRLGNIVPGIFRGVTKDIEMKGTTIPAGSTVMVCPSAVHLNPAKYNDPLAFDPWRWEGQELHAGSKNFVAFGGGSRLCAGAHFAKVQVAVFLHYLVTKYRWKKIRGGEIIRKPGLVFPDGLHIQISAKYK